MSAPKIVAVGETASEPHKALSEAGTNPIAGPPFLPGDDVLTRRGKQRDDVEQNGERPLEEFVARDVRCGVAPGQAVERKWQHILRELQQTAREAIRRVAGRPDAASDVSRPTQ